MSSPRVFNDLVPPSPPFGTRGDEPPDAPTAPSQCHDITTYAAIGLAGGACMGYGFLLDTRDVINPKRIDVAADSNFAFWHSATFNNDGTKLVFTDEWGGGREPRCRATDKPEWGADAIFTISNGKLTQHAYYKMPAAQTPFENCVAHNGSLVPVPGRDILVQGWYQGGISVVDFTDAAHPKEIAFFDRGPVDSTKLVSFAGVWSAYWYNGLIVSSEISRGLDVFNCSRAICSRKTRSTRRRSCISTSSTRRCRNRSSGRRRSRSRGRTSINWLAAEPPRRRDRECEA